MNKELEKNITFLKDMIKEYKTFGDLHNPEFEDTEKIYKVLETVLNYIENSIPKEDVRRGGKTIEVAIELRNRIKQLPKGKIYGIINLGNGILLTQDEAVNKKAIKELFNYDRLNYIDCIKANTKMEAIREYIEHLEKELLEGK